MAKKNTTRKQKEETLAALLKLLPDAKEESVQTVAMAMLTGYNLGKQAAAQTA